MQNHILFLEEKGYKISTSDNGQNGVEKSKEKEFDLVLLDQFMPGIDGIEVLKEIKENKFNLYKCWKRISNKIKKLNIYTGRGIRFSKQIIYKKSGKVSSYK